MEKPEMRLPPEPFGTTEKPGIDFESVSAGIRTASLLVMALSLAVMAVVFVVVGVHVIDFLDGSAWEAPWLNVINRGPVQ